jgi:succinoglycan biosynthesis transport protein ExoP
MLDELLDQGPPTLRDYLQIIWRRKWLVLQALILIPVAAVLWAQQGATVYTASAGVLMETENLGANVAGVQDPSQMNPSRVIQTQIPVARLPVVARQTVEAAGLKDWSPSDLLGRSTVTSAADNSDILTFAVTDPRAALAVRLANEYARQFTRYRRQLDTAAIESARKAVSARITALEAAGRQRSGLYANLVLTEQRLSTLETLQTSRAVLVRPASGAAKNGPALKKDAVFGLTLGLLLGLGLAFLRDGLDTRVRAADVVSRELGLPLLGRLVEPPRRIRRRKKLVTLAEPYSAQSEAFRMLAPNIEFMNLKTQARLITLTSAVEREGKSTTAANLAVAFARGGARVVLVDFDPYSSTLLEFFDISPRSDLTSRAGLTDVIVGQIPLETALVEVNVSPGRLVHDSSNEHAAGVSHGRLEIMPWGESASGSHDVAGSAALRTVLEQLRARADLVLLDAPPLLRTADAIMASFHVDALLVVVRLNFIRRATLDDLRRVLASCPAPKLGFIATGADAESGYGFSAYSYFDRKVLDQSRSRVER